MRPASPRPTVPPPTTITGTLVPTPRRGREPRSAVSVVGANGFIGRSIVAALRARGHLVHGFGRETPAVSDGRLDPRIRRSAHVIWAASSINPMIAESDPARVALDLNAFEVFLRLAGDATSGPRTILLGSGGTVYDQSAEPPYSESSPVAPRSAYGRAKRALEEILLTSSPRGLVFRIANAYGAGQPVAPGQGVISHWLHALAAGEAAHVFGSLEVARDYVHVSDIAAAVVRAVETDFDGAPVLNIGSGRATSLRDLLDIVRESVAGHPVPVQRHDARNFDARSTWLDCSLASQSLGWSAQRQLGDGVAETWAAVREAATGLVSDGAAEARRRARPLSTPIPRGALA